MNAPAENRLLVRRWSSNCRVPRDHPAPEEVRKRIDYTTAEHLPSILRDALSISGGDGIWLVRRLEIAVDANLGWKPESIARELARGIVKELRAAMRETGRTDPDVRYFPDRAHFQARFLVDLIEDRAWSRWYYRQFRGLKMLPVSAIVRTVLTGYGEVDPFEILSALPSDAVERVLATMSPADARRVLVYSRERLTEGRDPESVVDDLLSHAGSVDRGLRAGMNESATVTAVLVSGYRAGAGWVCAESINILLAFRRVQDRYAASGRPDRIPPDRIIRSLVERHPADAEYLGPLLALPAATQARIVKTLTPGPAPTDEPYPSAPPVSTTAFGFAFVLARFLQQLPQPDWSRIARLEGTAADCAFLRLWLVLKCLGARHAVRAAFDPVVGRLLGLEGMMDPVRFREWQRLFRGPGVEHWFEAVRDWQREAGLIAEEIILGFRVRDEAGAFTLLQDAAGGWFGAFTPGKDGRRSGQRALVQRLEGAATGFYADRGVSVGGSVDRKKPLSAVPEEDPAASETLARARQLDDDIQWLTLPETLCGDRERDRQLGMVAHAIMRSLSRRLPGFARASLPYLYANFFSFEADWSHDNGVELVEFGKAPLHIVLKMTGVARGDYRLDWWPDCVFRTEVP